jgi:nitrate reductase beta subunit
MYVLAPNQTVEKFPYSIGDLRKDNPQTSFPKNPSDATLASYNVFPVVSTGAVYDSATQVATQEGCHYNADKQRWETSWVVRDMTPEEIGQKLQSLQRQIANQTQVRLDDFAKTRNYDGMLSLCTYATSTNPKFAAEGQYGVEARDATWAALYEMLAEVEAGTRPIPSGFADIEPELPELIWPV